MEIWGGIECTINRIHDLYFDQLDFSGHYHRKEDLDLFINLGIKKIRYPLLWEKHEPLKNEKINWEETAKKLHYLKENGVEPIVGLVHHGSGPNYVNMLDNSFVEGLAAYAQKVASRFPWINYFTPVNEPLTTARFCGLYGWWYPHKKDDKSFLRILMNECKATVAAMKLIREINSNAILLQTEDLGKTYSTPSLHYQAEFQNHRRWLFFDLISGKVNPSHALWDYLISNDICEEELFSLLEGYSVPDIFGYNYYVTSERFLDERIERYPTITHGGNAFCKYADIEAYRSSIEPDGFRKLLIEAAKRYHQPIAITEAHLHCRREDQLRWLHRIWEIAIELKNQGLNIKAITPWALLGSYGWADLLTNNSWNYEPGAFDIRGGKVRPTAISKLIKCWTQEKDFPYPILDLSGWWERPERVVYTDIKFNFLPSYSTSRQSFPILIIGATGNLGKAFAKICTCRNLPFKSLTRAELELTNDLQIEEVIKYYKPWAIVNTAGFVNIEAAEFEAIKCYQSNTYGAEKLAIYTKKYNLRFLTFSSDLVFDGIKSTPYLEEDAVNPLNLYGKSKAEAEKLVLKANTDSLIIRTSSFFSPWDNYNFVAKVLFALQRNKEIHIPYDVYISPTYVPDLIEECLDLLIDGENGIWHLTNAGEISWFQLAEKVAERSGSSPKLLKSLSLKDMGYEANRPHYSVLRSSRGNLLPSLENALDRYFN